MLVAVSKKNKFIASFIIIFGTLSFPVGNGQPCGNQHCVNCIGTLSLPVQAMTVNVPAASSSAELPERHWSACASCDTCPPPSTNQTAGFRSPSSYIEWQQQQQQHPFNGPSPGLPRWAGGISWTICKSAPRSRQTTTPAPHCSVFYRPDALPAAQPTASKHWRQFIHGVTVTSFDIYAIWFSPPSCG